MPNELPREVERRFQRIADANRVNASGLARSVARDDLDFIRTALTEALTKAREQDARALLQMSALVDEATAAARDAMALAEAEHKAREQAEEERDAYETAFGLAVERHADTSGGDPLEIACIRNALYQEAKASLTPDQETAKTCPTCGSDDPKVRHVVHTHGIKREALPLPHNCPSCHSDLTERNVDVVIRMGCWGSTHDGKLDDIWIGDDDLDYSVLLEVGCPVCGTTVYSGEGDHAY